MVEVHVVVVHCGTDRVGTFRFELLARAGFPVVLRSHLSQESVPQSERGIAEAAELAAIEQFGENSGPGNDDFGAPRPHTGQFAALVNWKASQHLRDAFHLRPRNGRRTRTFGFVNTVTDSGQRGGASRSSDYNFRPRANDAGCNPADFAFNEGAKLRHFRFSRRVMFEKFIGEADGAERQADGVPNVPLYRDGELATSAAKVDQQDRRCGDPLQGDNAEMNQAGFFQPGDDLDVPARGRSDPLQEGSRITRVSQGTGSDNPDKFSARFLHCTVKPAQHL